jgi:hypothetical protein
MQMASSLPHKQVTVTSNVTVSTNNEKSIAMTWKAVRGPNGGLVYRWVKVVR